MYTHVVFATVVPDDGGLRSAEDEDQRPYRSQTPPTPPTEVTLMCTEHLLMIRYEANVILCAIPSP